MRSIQDLKIQAYKLQICIFSLIQKVSFRFKCFFNSVMVQRGAKIRTDNILTVNQEPDRPIIPYMDKYIVYLTS